MCGTREGSTTLPILGGVGAESMEGSYERGPGQTREDGPSNRSFFFGGGGGREEVGSVRSVSSPTDLSPSLLPRVPLPPSLGSGKDGRRTNQGEIPKGSWMGERPPGFLSHRTIQPTTRFDRVVHGNEKARSMDGTKKRYTLSRTKRRDRLVPFGSREGTGTMLRSCETDLPDSVDLRRRVPRRSSCCER